jgi:hypothetical protein
MRLGMLLKTQGRGHVDHSFYQLGFSNGSSSIAALKLRASEAFTQWL